ncbi:MAG: hypothetical protein KQH63_07620 [Desulfobulbaceae bacterium]|nr:hypothetical protein [Desulfobulbaceae bacterium]
MLALWLTVCLVILKELGVDMFADSAVFIKGRIRTKPIRQWMVGREFLRRVKHAFDDHNIEVSFSNRKVYVDEKSRPFDLQILDKFQKNKEPAE